MRQPKISIITPVYNMLPYLQKCVRSVNDQDVSFEHIIIDGGSSDGTKEWLKDVPALNWISEKDKGMYDALNKGLSMAKGEIIAHLNADEQYLTGSLNYILEFFESHPDIDYVVADFLLVDKNGALIAARKSFPPFWPFFFSNYLYTFTCTLFYRKKVIEKLRYDDNLKSIADMDFVYKIQKQGFKGAHLRKFISAFTFTGSNLSIHPLSNEERQAYEKKYLPQWFKLIKPALQMAFYSVRLIYGTFWHRGRIQYELYDNSFTITRKKYIASNPSCRWV